MAESVLVIAAHPDDEVLGCGGLIARYSSLSIPVNVVFLADGVTSRKEIDTHTDELKLRQHAANKAADILGIDSVSFYQLPDNRMDSIDLIDIVQIVEEMVAKYQPDTILTHHVGDLNVDHSAVNKAVMTACRPQSGHPVKSILSFEVPSSTEWQYSSHHESFTPNWFVDISTYLEHKLEALQCYSDELREWPHPRSLLGVETLARWRGAIVGVDAAEAFYLNRHVI